MESLIGAAPPAPVDRARCSPRSAPMSAPPPTRAGRRQAVREARVVEHLSQRLGDRRGDDGSTSSAAPAATSSVDVPAEVTTGVPWTIASSTGSPNPSLGSGSRTRPLRPATARRWSSVRKPESARPAHVPSHRAARGARRAAAPSLRPDEHELDVSIGRSHGARTPRPARAGSCAARPSRPTRRTGVGVAARSSSPRSRRSDAGCSSDPSSTTRRRSSRALPRRSRSSSPRTSTPRGPRGPASSRPAPHEAVAPARELRRVIEKREVVDRHDERGARRRDDQARGVHDVDGARRRSTCGHRTPCQASYIAARGIGSDGPGPRGVHGDDGVRR